MAITNLGRRVKERAEKMVQQLAFDIAGGGAKDFAEYRYHVGYVAGIRDLVAILEELENV